MLLSCPFSRIHFGVTVFSVGACSVPEQYPGLGVGRGLSADTRGGGDHTAFRIGRPNLNSVGLMRTADSNFPGGMPPPGGMLRRGCSGAVPCRTLQCRAVPCCTVPCRAVPCRAVPCRAVRCRDVLCRTVPCCAVLCRAVTLRAAAVPCRVVSCRAVVTGTGWWRKHRAMFREVVNECRCSMLFSGRRNSRSFVTGLVKTELLNPFMQRCRQIHSGRTLVWHPDLYLLHSTHCTELPPNSLCFWLIYGMSTEVT